MKRIVLAITGASGMPYAIGLARALKAMDGLETHMIVSKAAVQVLEVESDITPGELGALADKVYPSGDLAAPPSSGSWIHHGMIVAPCSMATLAAIATGVGDNLVHRAADVTLKEGRPLILLARETPLNKVHLANMLAAAEAGAVVMPACPGFYHKPQTIEDLVGRMVGRILDRLGIANDLAARWGE